MNLYTKLFKRKEFKIEGDNLNLLSNIAERVINNNFNDIDIKQLESFIYFNPKNPFLHQVYGTSFFLRSQQQNTDNHFDKAIYLDIKDGGYTLYIKALNNISINLYSYDALDALKMIINRKSVFEIQNTDEPESGIFIKTNEFGFSSAYIDLRNSNTLGDIYCYLGSCYNAFQMNYEAIEQIEKAIAICPENEDYKLKQFQFKKGNLNFN